MNIQYKLILVFLLQLFFVACDSHDQPTESAFEKVRREKLVKLDSAAQVTDEQEKIEPVESLLTEKITDSWTHFKLETGKRLDKNDRAILKIKRTRDLSVSSFKKATVLENENDDLRTRLTEFMDSEKESQDKFKLKIQQDLDELNADIEMLRTKYETQI